MSSPTGISRASLASIGATGGVTGRLTSSAFRAGFFWAGGSCAAFFWAGFFWTSAGRLRRETLDHFRLLAHVFSESNQDRPFDEARDEWGTYDHLPLHKLVRRL